MINAAPPFPEGSDRQSTPSVRPGGGRNGRRGRRGATRPYTEALLAHSETPGLKLSLLFRKVADDVQRRTGGRQAPYEYGRLPGTSIYLKPPEAEPAEVLQARDDRCRDESFTRPGCIVITFCDN